MNFYSSFHLVLSYYGLLMIHGNNKSFDVVFCSLAAERKKRQRGGRSKSLVFSIHAPLAHANLPVLELVVAFYIEAMRGGYHYL